MFPYFFENALGLAADGADVVVRLLIDIALVLIAADGADVGFLRLGGLCELRIFVENLPHHDAVMSFLTREDFHLIGCLRKTGCAHLVRDGLFTSPQVSAFSRPRTRLQKF